jgi:hypothetical protein
MEFKMKGRKVQRQLIISIKTREIIILRLSPFIWFYFNIGQYLNSRRIAFDCFFELGNSINGFGFEKVFEEWSD